MRPAGIPREPFIRAALGLLACCALARPAIAAPVSPYSATIEGTCEPDALLRVRGAVIRVHGDAPMVAGVAVGAGRLRSLELDLELVSLLPAPVEEATVEVTLVREPGDGASTPAGDDPERPEGPRDDASPYPGWSARHTVAQIAPGQPAHLRAQSPLAELPAAARPDTLAQVGYRVWVLGYRCPSVSLADALEAVRRGSAVDAQALLHSYGAGLSIPQRSADESYLIASLRRASPPPRPAPAARSDESARRSSAEFALLLVAARRIGEEATLALLLADEDRLSGLDRAPASDGTEPGEAVPAAEVHEALLAVARHNVAEVYALAQQPPGQASRTAGEAARRLVRDEGWSSADEWLEAPSDSSAAQGPDDPLTARSRAAIAVVLAHAGTAADRDALVRAFGAPRASLRSAGTVGLAALGPIGWDTLIPALDTDDEERRASIVAALSTTPTEALPELARRAGPEASASAGAPALAEKIAADRAAARARAVAEALDEAERAAAQLGEEGGDRAARLLEEARALSGALFDSHLAQAARTAAAIYRSRRSAGRPMAWSVLDTVAARLPPTALREPAWSAALHAARIDRARAMPPDHGLAAAAILCPEDDGPTTIADPEDRAVAIQILLEHARWAIDAGQPPSARRALERARALGASPAEVEALARRALWRRVVRPGLGLAALLVAGLVLWRLRRRR